MRNIAPHFIFQCFVAKAENFAIIVSVIKRLGTVGELFAVFHLQFDHQFAKIRLCILRVNIQHLFAVNIGVIPFAVFEKQKCTFQYRRNVGAGRSVAYNHRLLDGGVAFFFDGNLLDASDKVVDKADFAHILCLQMSKLLGEFVGVHIAIARNEELLSVGFHQFEKTAPLVLYPHCREIFRLGTDDEHDFRTMKRGEDIRLVFPPDFIFQRNRRIEDLEALLRQLIVNIVGNHAILRALSVCVGFLIADEYVEGLFVFDDSKNILLDTVNFFRFGFV